MSTDRPDLGWLPASPARWRVRTHWRLARHDRVNAARARVHGATAVLDSASWIVELGRCDGPDARTTCVRCAGGDPTVTGYCLVCALVAAGGQAADEATPAVRTAIDVTWRALHRRGRRPVHWNPSVMHLLQAHELRRWDQRRDVTAAHVQALLATARGDASLARAGRPS